MDTQHENYEMKKTEFHNISKRIIYLHINKIIYRLYEYQNCDISFDCKYIFWIINIHIYQDKITNPMISCSFHHS